MIKTEDIRLGVSPMSETVYAGKISPDGSRFIGEKKDVTSDFIKAIIDKFGNSTAVIGAKGFKQYRITVEEIKGDVK